MVESRGHCLSSRVRASNKDLKGPEPGRQALGQTTSGGFFFFCLELGTV